MSHPSRVRGLKFYPEDLGSDPFRSHPSRVRGLKLSPIMSRNARSQSHPSRVRGLKFNGFAADGTNYDVAPFTGAWIEII